MKRIVSMVLTLVLALSVVADAAVPTLQAGQNPVKNVILLIPDGQSVGGTTLTRWYRGGTLAVDEMACGLVRTYSADAAIADSAPAGTAMATGFKSHTGYIGVLPDVSNMPGLTQTNPQDAKKPVANIVEAAQRKGKATGIIATSEIMHATPAAFTAHDPSRKNYDNLSEQQVYRGIDVVLGGGAKFFTAQERGDKEDLTTEIKNRGYDYVTDRTAMLNSTSSKLWGMFAPADMSYEMDRNKVEQPSLAEMTTKALDVLAKDPDGFFLMVEGSKIDWAAHANDPIGLISDNIAFDDAVKAALDYAKTKGDTIVIVATDHGNGGVTIGNSNTDSTYDKLHIDSYLTQLKKATITGEGVEKMLNADRSNIRQVMSQYYGIADLTDAEVAAIEKTSAGSMNYTVGPMISKRANIGWTTTGHTGEDVPLYIFAPEGRQRTGVVENADIAKYIEAQLGLDLAVTGQALFIPLRKTAEEKGASVMWNAGNGNPYVTIVKGDTTIKAHYNKSIVDVNGKTVQLDGTVIFNGIETYAPQTLVNLIP